jgi:hypothetical protein
LLIQRQAENRLEATINVLGSQWHQKTPGAQVFGADTHSGAVLVRFELP